MKLPIVQLSPFSRYFIPLRSKYSPQHPVVLRDLKSRKNIFNIFTNGVQDHVQRTSETSHNCSCSFFTVTYDCRCKRHTKMQVVAVFISATRHINEHGTGYVDMIMLKVRGHIHAWAVLYPRKSPNYTLDRRVDGFQSRSKGAG
jgi:hypothetical protein